MDASWTEMGNPDPPPPFSLVAFYIGNGRYVFGCGIDYDHIKREFPSVTHWKVITREPEKDGRT